MSVVTHGYGELGGGKDRGQAGMHAGQSQEGLIVCREMPELFPFARWRH